MYGRLLAALTLAVVALAVAACESGEEAPTPTPTATAGLAATASTVASTATVEPTPTASPSPTTATSTAVATTTVTPTVAPTATPTPTSEPTPAASPAPAQTVTVTPEPDAIEFMPITRGSPRELPTDIALYYWLGTCTACDTGIYDLRRVVIDEASGSFREDRPLAHFDDVNDHFAVVDYGVSESGREMAAGICHVGHCSVGVRYLTVDAEQRVWVTRDGGATWEDLGPALPGALIVEVTAQDVLILEYNLWDVRRYWGGVTDEEWGEMLVRLAPLGAGSLDGPYRLRWLVSGEEFVPAGRDESRQWFRYWGWMEGQPVWVQGYSRLSVPLPGDVEGLPAFGLGGLDWTLADVRSDGAIAWTASDQGRHLLDRGPSGGRPGGVHRGGTAVGPVRDG